MSFAVSTSGFRPHTNYFVTKPVQFEQSMQVIQVIDNFCASMVALPKA